jgi:hypothetical protein
MYGNISIVWDVNSLVERMTRRGSALITGPVSEWSFTGGDFYLTTDNGHRHRLIGFAKKVKWNEAKRHFDTGGCVVVDTHGNIENFAVFDTTTKHNRDSTTWAELAETVAAFRGTHPDQRYYIVRYLTADDFAPEGLSNEALGVVNGWTVISRRGDFSSFTRGRFSYELSGPRSFDEPDRLREEIRDAEGIVTYVGYENPRVFRGPETFIRSFRKILTKEDPDTKNIAA